MNILSDMRHRMGYTVVVIHNKQAKREFVETANLAYAWDSFLGVPPKDPKSKEIKNGPEKVKKDTKKEYKSEK